MYLARSTRVDLAEHNLLELVVEGQHTSTGNTTENVGTSTLEQRLGTFLCDNLGSCVEHGLVVYGRAGGHHHATTDSIKRIRSKTSTNGNTPAEQERGEERALESTNKHDRLERIVDTKVETTVHDDTNDRGDESTVKSSDAVRREGLAVDIDEAVELALSASLLGRLGVVGQTSTGIVEGVDEQEGRGTSRTTRRDVASKPLPVTILLFEAEQGLEVVLEGKVQSLGGEVTDNVGRVTTPERNQALVRIGASEAVDDALVWVRETTLLDHLILVLDEELDTLDGGRRGLGDGRRDTTHHKVDRKVARRLDTLLELGHGVVGRKILDA